MKNSLTDLNNHLFAQLERLNDEELTGDNLKEEMSRAKAISSISKNIVDNARVLLDAQKKIQHGDLDGVKSDKLLGINKNES